MFNHNFDIGSRRFSVLVFNKHGDTGTSGYESRISGETLLDQLNN